MPCEKNSVGVDNNQLQDQACVSEIMRYLSKITGYRFTIVIIEIKVLFIRDSTLHTWMYMYCEQ